MSSPIVIICHNHPLPLFLLHNITPSSPSYSSKFSTSVVSSLPPHRTRLSLFIANANHNNNNNNNNNINNNYGGQRRRRRSWWHNFFFDEEGNWFGLKKDPLLDDDDDDVDGDEEKRFQAWKRRAEAISELREMQEGVRNAQNRRWEDWLHVQGPSSSSSSSSTSSSWDQDWGDELDSLLQDIRPATTGQMMPQRGFIDSARQLLLRDDDDDDDDDFTYEDRVFQYASSNSAKFLAFLVIVPWALDFMVHDYLLMPFLDRYVKTVPLAAEFFDVRRSQKLDMIKSLKVEEARFRFETEIGKSPPLSDEEVWLELRHKALELRDEWRLENRKRFANIWSDMVYGIALFILLYFNQSKVALLQFTGYKILSNVSDTGKAFLIILITDIFLGYHSESGWQTLLEILVEHYGLEVDQSAITIFVCFVPVVIDACVKLWLFKFLPRLSPKVANIFQEMKRH